jgi:hypothetical protein
MNTGARSAIVVNPHGMSINRMVPQNDCGDEQKRQGRTSYGKGFVRTMIAASAIAVKIPAFLKRPFEALLIETRCPSAAFAALSELLIMRGLHPTHR